MTVVPAQLTHDIEPPETGDHPIPQSNPVGFAGDIVADEQCRAALRGDRSGERLSGLVLKVGDDHAGPFACQSLHRGSTDAARAARHDRDPFRQHAPSYAPGPDCACSKPAGMPHQEPRNSAGISGTRRPPCGKKNACRVREIAARKSVVTSQSLQVSGHTARGSIPRRRRSAQPSMRTARPDDFTILEFEQGLIGLILRPSGRPARA